MASLLIHHTDLIRTQPRLDTYPDQDIAIVNQHITAVESGGSINPGNFDEVIDGRGMVALPGFINTHCHIPMVLFRGIAEDVSIESWFNDHVFQVESNLTEEDVYWGALLGIVEMIEAGITTVADHYFNMNAVAHAIEQSGMRANLVLAMFGSNAEQELETATRFIERWQGGAEGRITTWLGPHSPYICPESFLRQVAQRARTLDVGNHIHVSETRNQVQESLDKYAKTPVEFLEAVGLFSQPTLCAHVAHPTLQDIQILSANGVAVAHCPKTFLKLTSGIAPVLAMREAGIAVGLGTDGAASNATLDILEAARLAALLQKHEHQDSTRATLEEVFQMAFLDSARALHMDHIGDLAPGSLADLILIRQDAAAMVPQTNLPANILYSASARDVDTTICNGQVLMRGRQLRTLDKARIVSEVRSRLTRLYRRGTAHQHY